MCRVLALHHQRGGNGKARRGNHHDQQHQRAHVEGPRLGQAEEAQGNDAGQHVEGELLLEQLPVLGDQQADHGSIEGHATPPERTAVTKMSSSAIGSARWTWRPCAARRAGSWSFQARALISTTLRSEEHTSELQSLMRIPSAVFCLQKKT